MGNKLDEGGDLRLQHFAKWWSLGVFVAVLAVVTLTYVGAHAEDHLPKHHPWPAISVVALSLIPLAVTGERKTWQWFYKITMSALAMALAIVVNRIT
jgi:hypothetical protein